MESICPHCNVKFNPDLLEIGREMGGRLKPPVILNNGFRLREVEVGMGVAWGALDKQELINETEMPGMQCVCSEEGDIHLLDLSRVPCRHSRAHGGDMSGGTGGRLDRGGLRSG